MKPIMENWKSFLVENKKEKIKNLKYGEITTRRHRRDVTKELEVIDIKMSEIPITKYPENDSDEVKQEIKSVLNAMTNNREISKDDLKRTDRQPLKLFTKYLKAEKIKFDQSFLSKIYNDAGKISLRLKIRYDRPRPEQLGPLLGFDIKSIKTDSDDTPAYPSGHTMQAWTMAYYLEDKYPEHKDKFYEIAEMIEKSRIVRGAHYPSDNKEAKRIAKKYLYPNIKRKSR